MMNNSEIQFRQLFNFIPQLVWITDNAGNAQWYNDSWYAYTGASLEEMKTLGWKKVCHPDHLVRIKEKIHKAFEDGQGWEDTFLLCGKDGRYRWFSSRVYPLRDEQDEIIRWFGSNTELPERLERDQLINDNELLSQSFVENSSDCIQMLDLEGRLLMLNESVRKALEIENSAVYLGKEWQELWPDETKPLVKTVLEQARQAKSAQFEAFGPTVLGIPKWWEVTLSRINASHETGVDRILCVSRDITPRKKIETELQEALKEAREAHAKSQEANKRKDEFLANMSHELRTPMNAIIGIGHILSKTAPLNDKQLKCIKTLQSSSESLLALINDLLDLAKIESENIKLENIPFNLQEILEEVATMSRVMADEKKIALTTDYDKRLQDKYIADPHRLKQIIMNLTSNAVKFTENGGVHISVRLKSETNRLVNIAIHFIDTGTGISQDQLHNIFNKFSQGDTSISRKYGGTGLGLAISKTLATLMGGDITVQSQVGAGSEFILHLPLVRDNFTLSKRISRVFNLLSSSGSAKPEISKIPAIINDYAPLVLIVEDYKPNLLVASSYMELLGFRYETAQNGEEAVFKIQNNRYDIVLMDVQMPGMDGLTATRIIRKWEKKYNLYPLPIIGVTAYALIGDKEKCLEAGMDDYVTKPFVPEVIQRKIERFTSANVSSQSQEALCN